MLKYIIIHPDDNVAVALQPLAAGDTIEHKGQTTIVKETIPAGHKVMLTDANKGDFIIK